MGHFICGLGSKGKKGPSFQDPFCKRKPSNSKTNLKNESLDLLAVLAGLTHGKNAMSLAS